MTTRKILSADTLKTLEEKMTALSYLHEAWAEALHDGIDGDCIAQAALFSALSEMTVVYGEEATAIFTEGLSRRVRVGEFTVPVDRQ